jgi:hypothetical protein
MKTVKAIVMTCDKYRALTDHMIFKYEQLWPNHPFHFRVPYQKFGSNLATDKVEYKKTPLAIKATVLSLLEDLDDEELIYWCIDDKYPIKLDVSGIERAYQWLSEEDPPEVDGILFCRHGSLWNPKCLTGQKIVDNSKNVYLERKGYKQIWIHQFLRVKILRYLFQSLPDEISFAKDMDRLRKQVEKPQSHRIFVSRQNLAVFGESTSRGLVTQNCYRSIIENDLALPAWCSETTDSEIVMGALDNRRSPIKAIPYFIKKLTRRPT